MALRDEVARKKAKATRIHLQLMCEDVVPTDIVITCETCDDNADCEFAFDAYNTEGDCLAIK